MAYKKRTIEERVAEIDTKIASHKLVISKLEEKKNAILNPKSKAKKSTIKNILSQAKANGMSADEIAKKLGIEINQ